MSDPFVLLVCGGRRFSDAAWLFEGGAGTRDMVRRCREAGVPVWCP
jgi:hypothetical protein